MKKIVFMDESDRQGFLNYMESMKQVESDKDVFCEATRLERKPRQPMSTEKFYAVLYATVGIVAIVSVAAVLLAMILH